MNNTKSTGHRSKEHLGGTRRERSSHFVKEMRRGYPNSIQLLPESREYFSAEVPLPPIPKKEIALCTGEPNAEKAVKAIATKYVQTHQAVLMEQEVREAVDYLNREDKSMRSYEKRAVAAFNREPRKLRKLVNSVTKPRTWRQRWVKGAQFGEWMTWMGFVGAGLLSEMVNAFSNTPSMTDDAWLMQAGPRIAFCAWTFLCPFVLLKRYGSLSIDRSRHLFEKRLVRVSMGIVTVCLLFFSMKLAELHGPITMSAKGWTPPYAAMFFGIQISLASMVYAASRLAGEAWATLHGYEYIDAPGSLLASQDVERVGRCRRELGAIRGLINGAGESLIPRKARFEETCLGHLRATKKRLAEQQQYKTEAKAQRAARLRMIEEQAKAAAALKLLDEGDGGVNAA